MSSNKEHKIRQLVKKQLQANEDNYENVRAVRKKIQAGIKIEDLPFNERNILNIYNRKKEQLTKQFTRSLK